MSAAFSQASGTSIIIAWSRSRPDCTTRSRTLSSIALSLPPGRITGSRSRIRSRQTPERSAPSRARIQFTFPHSVLISPLWASRRNGCARGQLGNVFVL